MLILQVRKLAFIPDVAKDATSNAGEHFDTIGGNVEFYLQTPFDWDKLMEDFEGRDLLNNSRL